MKKYYSKKERETRKIIKIFIITIACIIVVLGISSFFPDKYNQSKSTYTEEELIHDHDGDGVPEH